MEATSSPTHKSPFKSLTIQALSFTAVVGILLPNITGGVLGNELIKKRVECDNIRVSSDEDRNAAEKRKCNAELEGIQMWADVVDNIFVALGFGGIGIAGYGRARAEGPLEI